VLARNHGHAHRGHHNDDDDDVGHRHGDGDGDTTTHHHDHDDDDDDRELTEEEKDLIAVRCLRFFNVLLMLVGGTLCGVSLWTSTTTVGGVGTSIIYAVAGVGGVIFAVTLLGLVGALARIQQVLLFYYTCLIFTAFAMLVLGGFCFLLYASAVQWVEANWVFLLQAIPQPQRATITLDRYRSALTYTMYGVGAAAFLVLALLLCAMSNVVRLVTPLRAYTLLLQATTTTLLPVGIALVGVGAWVADTAVTQEAVFSAFSIFVLGMAVLVLILVGCTSTSLRSRGLIRVFFFLTLLLTLAFLAFGVTALASGDLVRNALVKQWATLRNLLPSNFAGKYDVLQFEQYLNTNLRALGFFALCTGVLMAAQSFGAVRLRFELKAAKELEEQAVEAEKTGLITREDLDALLAMRQPSTPEKIWKRTWTNGSRTSRCAVVFCLLFACFVVVVVMGVAVAALYYSTSCSSLATFSQVYDYAGENLGSYVAISNNYTRGTLSLAVRGAAAAAAAGMATTLTFKKSAYVERMAAAGYPALRRVSTPWPSVGSPSALALFAAGESPGGLAAPAAATTPVVGFDLFGDGATRPVALTSVATFPAAPTRYLDYDVSCQASVLTLTLPPASVLGGNSFEVSAALPYAVALATGTDTTAIEIDWTGVAVAERPRLYRLDLSSDAAHMDVRGLLLGGKGLLALSSSGKVDVADLDARCDPADLGAETGGLRLATSKGSVTLARASVRDCDVYLRGAEAPAAVADVRIANALGGGRLVMEGTTGTLSATSTSADFVDLRAEAGSVQMTNVSVGQSLRVSTTDGKVTIAQLRLAARAGLQIDTDAGAVEVWASNFAGILSVVTGGSVTCTGAGFDEAQPCSRRTAEAGADGTPLTVVEQVNVNCLTRGDCAYLGGVTITSARGDVLVRMDKWVR
jgi:hypothetical protein